MKKLLLGSVALIALAGGMSSAPAADVAPVYKAPPPVPAWTWTGFYAGGNLGYSVARDPGAVDYVNAIFAPGTARYNFAPAGAIGGGQIGFNVQANRNWVFGLEADIQTSGQRDNFTCILNCIVPPAGPFGTTVEQRLQWFGTVRGRLGWTNGPALWYVTGGLAYGQMRTDINTINFATGAPQLFSFSDSKTGWTLGGGLEYRLAGNWTAKVEYLYLDLGSISHTFLENLFFPGATTTSTTYTSNIRDHVVRFGLNYKFDWSDPGVVTAAAYPAPVYKAPPALAPAWNWTGLYAGVNLGYSVARNPTSKTSVFNNGVTIQHEDFYLQPIGVIGGGQIGFNWQVASLVFGVEADFQGSAQRDSTTCANFCDPTPGGSITLVEQKLPWFGTVRGRAGWTNGPGLLYLTGGLAYGRVDTNITASDFNGIPLVLTPFNFSHVKTGWTAGAGLEHQVIGNWTAKVEYLYLDLGSATDTYVQPPPPSVFTTTHTVTTTIRDHIVRVGLNYKFGDPVVVAKY